MTGANRQILVQMAGLLTISLKYPGRPAVHTDMSAPAARLAVPARLATRSSRRRHRVARAAAVSRTTTALARRAGGPEDRALYRCGCGLSFTADVSATVGCPRCGTCQAW